MAISEFEAMPDKVDDEVDHAVAATRLLQVQLTPVRAPESYEPWDRHHEDDHGDPPDYTSKITGGGCVSHFAY